MVDRIQHIRILACLSVMGLMTTCVSAQSVTYTDHISPIIATQCLPCHREGEAGPFPLETYEQVREHSRLIEKVTTQGIMPPWKADPAYCHYANERILTAKQIDMIRQWVSSGCPRGKGVAAVYKPSHYDLPKPDMVVKFKKPYKIVGDNYDWFITYIQQIELPENTWLKAIRVVPGNKKMVHHLRVDLDTTDKFVPYADADGFASTNLLDNTRSQASISFLGDYVPGISPLVYPDGMGYRLPSRAYIMINVHYSPSAADEYDQSEVHLYFYPKEKPPVRIVEHINYSAPKEVLKKIDHDSVETFSFATAPISKAYSLLSIQPHMHLIGKSVKIFATTPTGDTIPMCYIPDWDFNWQENYYLSKPVILPIHSVLHAIGVYDNTTKNIRNPDNPPKDAYFNKSMLTKNEMFDFYLKVTEYQHGDERLDLSRK